MTSGRTLAGRLLAGAAAVVALAGCATVPSSGPVHIAKALPQARGIEAQDVHFLPPKPVPAEQPEDIVRGFLDASTSAEDDFAIAREYLVPDAAKSWRPQQGGVTVYSGRADVKASRQGNQVTVTVARRGVIAADGGYTPRPGTLRITVPLQRVDKEWRVAQPPPTLLLSTADVARGFRAVDVFFLAPSGKTLVPDRVFMQFSRSGVATELVHRVLAGPSAWLAPAVTSAFPQGTHLVGDVPVDNGVAEVRLSHEVLQADGDARRALSAQLVWTLRQLSSVAAVRIVVDGEPLDVPGASDRQSREDWKSFDPDVVGTHADLYYEADGRLRTRQAPLENTPFGTGEFPVAEPAVSPTLDIAAGLRQRADGSVGLYAGPLNRGAPKLLVSAAAFTPPSIDVSSRIWTVATDANGVQRVVVADAQGGVQTVPADELFAYGRVSALRVSRDGARVAAVVGRDTATLVVARVDVRAGGMHLDGTRQVLGDGYTDVASVTWRDADHIVVLARSAGAGSATTGRFPVTATPDGWEAVPGSAAGLPDDVTPLHHITGAPGDRPLVVAAGDGIWEFGGIWRRVGDGTYPVYPG